MKSQLEDLYGALEDYNKVLMLNPENIYTYYNRAVILHVLEDYRGAIADYTRAIELFPDFAGAYLNRSEAKRSLRDEKGAYLDYQKAISIMENINFNGYDSLTVRQFADSAYFDKIIEFEADFVKVDMKDSISNRSVDLEPAFMVQVLLNPMLIIRKNPSVYDASGLITPGQTDSSSVKFVISNDQVDLSLEEAYFRLMKADSALATNPISAEVYFLKGIINSMVKNYNTALLEFDHSLMLDPGQPMVLLNKGYVLFEMAEHASAESKFSTPVTISWNEAEITSPPPEADLSQDYYKALETYDRLIALKPDFAFAYFNRANIKVRLKDYNGALADYTKSCSLESGLAEAYFNRALTMIYLNDTESACRDLSKAGELGLQQAYRVIQQFCKKQ
jgi:tetratricopeptide (TPR) repeat protein